MFGRRKKDTDGPTPAPSPAPQPTPDDALAAARRMSDVVFDGLVKPLKLERGVPSPVIAAVLGALAGHASQVATLSGLASNHPDYAGLSILTAGGENGDSYWMGDAINRPVLESKYSVYALVAGVNEKMGLPLPDLHELAGYVASTLGSERFGVPRDLPEGAPTPRSLLSLWSLGEALTKDVGHPDYVPVALTLAYQRLAQTDNAVDPTVDVAAMSRVMLESAIAMSKLKVAPTELGQAAAAV